MCPHSVDGNHVCPRLLLASWMSSTIENPTTSPTDKLKSCALSPVFNGCTNSKTDVVPLFWNAAPPSANPPSTFPQPNPLHGEERSNHSSMKVATPDTVE